MGTKQSTEEKHQVEENIFKKAYSTKFPKDYAVTFWYCDCKQKPCIKNTKMCGTKYSSEWWPPKTVNGQEVQAVEHFRRTAEIIPPSGTYTAWDVQYEGVNHVIFVWSESSAKLIAGNGYVRPEDVIIGEDYVKLYMLFMVDEKVKYIPISRTLVSLKPTKEEITYLVPFEEPPEKKTTYLVPFEAKKKEIDYLAPFESCDWDSEPEAQEASADIGSSSKGFLLLMEDEQTHIQASVAPPANTDSTVNIVAAKMSDEHDEHNVHADTQASVTSPANPDSMMNSVAAKMDVVIADMRDIMINPTSHSEAELDAKFTAAKAEIKSSTATIDKFTAAQAEIKSSTAVTAKQPRPIPAVVYATAEQQTPVFEAAVTNPELFTVRPHGHSYHYKSDGPVHISAREVLKWGDFRDCVGFAEQRLNDLRLSELPGARSSLYRERFESRGITKVEELIGTYLLHKKDEAILNACLTEFIIRDSHRLLAVKSIALWCEYHV